MFTKIPWEGWSAIAALVAAAIAMAAGVVSFLALRLQAKLAEQPFRVRTWSRLAQFADPSRYVGAYRVKTRVYLPITNDSKICEALDHGNDILLFGRGGIGKSHAAVQHIRAFSRRYWYQRWQLLSLDRMASPELVGFGVKRRNYILFLDDINEYAVGDDSNIFALIDRVRHLSKKVIVVATLRSTSGAIEAMSSGTKLFSRFQTIELDDWGDKQRLDLAALTGVSSEHWDGTPLSAKQPSTELQQVYKTLSNTDRRLLRALKLCAKYGLSYVNRRFLTSLCSHFWDKLSKDEFSSAINHVYGYGFLKSDGDKIQIYYPYLSFIDSNDSEGLFSKLCSFLKSSDFLEEIRIVGHGAYLLEEHIPSHDLLEEYVRRQPTSPVGNYRLARVLFRLAKTEEAIHYFRSAIDLYPTYYSALYQLGRAYEKLDDRDNARASYRRAWAAQSAETPAQLMALSELFRVSGQQKGALELISQSLDKDPNVVHGWGLKGQIHLQLGEVDAAEDAFEQALERDPDVFIYFGLGQVHRMQKNWEKAAFYFERAVQLSPHSGQIHSLLSQALQKTGKQKEAIAALETAISLGYRPAHFGLGILLKNQNKWQAAADQFEAATKADPALALGHSYLGTALERLGRIDDAVAAHNRAIHLEPRNKFHWVALALALDNAGRESQAIAAYETALRIDPKFAMASLRLQRLRPGPS